MNNGIPNAKRYIPFNKMSKPTMTPDIPKVRVNASKPLALFP
uniref:Uncharacterized protein n=1 Tax=Lotus japonicus TaxID=34305 RepID=I3S489_LOTJA|nr:unknown [Lotus japonicus]